MSTRSLEFKAQPIYNQKLAFITAPLVEHQMKQLAGVSRLCCMKNVYP